MRTIIRPAALPEQPEFARLCPPPQFVPADELPGLRWFHRALCCLVAWCAALACVVWWVLLQHPR